ncbi:MAG: MFS transporter, partial [Candidatus Sericytochromatia bacterium]|nr:MFS transporter [Candidatus Tanganyikabacteria bacterium]
MGVARNIRLYIPYHVLSLEGICHGLYIVWLLQHKGLSPAFLALVLALGDLVLMVAHVPTGLLADRLGRRWSLVVGSAVQVAGLALMWLGSGPWAFAASALAIGVGDAFRGGADEALLYESLARLGREAEFERRVARTGAWAQSALVVQVLLGGALVARFGFDAAWALEVAFALGGLVLALAMVEVPGAAISGSKPEIQVAARSGAFARFVPILVPASVAGALAGVASYGVEASWPGDPAAVARLTWVVALFMSAEAAGSFLAARRRPGSSDGQTLCGLAAVGVA